MEVSVALATYNGSAFLEEQLDSLYHQTRAVDELILSDDGSSDGTVGLARSVTARWTPGKPRVHIEENSRNLGVVGNFQRAVGRCTGDVIFLCDQDDFWYAHKVDRLMGEFERRPALLLVYSNAGLVGSSRQSLGATQFEALAVSASERALVRSGRAFEALVRRNLVTGATVAFRRELVALASPFPTNWIHDEWLAMVAAAVGSVDAVDDCLIDYRQHEGNQIGMQRRSLLRRLGEVLTERGNFHQRELERARVLRSHLLSLGGRVPVGILSQLNERIAHLQLRATLPRRRLARVAPIVREIRSGRYRRYGQGVRSIARDLLEAID